MQVANEPGANADKSESGSAGAGSQAGEDQKANGDRSQPKDTDEAVSPIVSIEKFSVARGSRGGNSTSASISEMSPRPPKRFQDGYLPS